MALAAGTPHGTYAYSMSVQHVISLMRISHSTQPIVPGNRVFCWSISSTDEQPGYT